MASILSKFLVFTLDPTLHWLAILVMALFLFAFQSSGVKRVLSALFVYMLVLLFSPISSWIFENLESRYPPNLDRAEKPAIVILTGGTVEFNRSVDQFQWYAHADRILVPAQNWKNSESLFILTGRSQVQEKFPFMVGEAESMALFLEEQGVVREKILVENKARTTRENAQNVALILKEKGIKDFYLVTSAFHMWRSMKSFQKLGLNPTPFPVDYSTTTSQRSWKSSVGYANIGRFRLAAHEFVGVLYYKVLDWLGA